MQFTAGTYRQLKQNWSEALRSKAFVIQLFVVVFILTVIAATISDFFTFIQNRKGYALNDLILSCIPPMDLSRLIFILIYGLVLVSLLNLLALPRKLLKGLQAYVILLMLRIVSIYLVPLESPVKLIPLTDPFIGRFFYEDALITKDLFFSGHVSTLYLLCLVNPTKNLRFIYYFITVVVAFALLIQNVHYTMDVALAPFFSWLSYRVALKVPSPDIISA